MTEKSLSILVLACGGNVSHGILKALSLSALSCRVVGADIAPMKPGLYTVDRACISPWAHEPDFMLWLLETCASEEIDAVLCGAEPVVKVLAEYQDEIREKTGAACVVSDLKSLMIGDDKLDCCRWLDAQGFTCPAYAASEDRHGLDRLVEAHGYPLVAKPRIGGSATGHYLLQNETDLTYIAHKQDYVIQQYIGNPEEEYTIGCFCDRSGQLAGSIAFRRGLQDGGSVYVEVGAYPEVREEAERIVARLKPRGPCNVQLRMHEGKPMCFEINVRFSGTTPVRARFGFNEVEAALRHFVLGEEISLPTITQGVMVRYWNEMYVDPQAYAQLKEHGRLPSPAEFQVDIEDYGMRR
ncbi:MAG: ATP-grasp domain-containing protein [Candidatus Hydrogenedentes bacterium]|nr:ATP-grasp domain-containing protein [Candidatus Hydrogenedentota bacterium]